MHCVVMCRLTDRRLFAPFPMVLFCYFQLYSRVRRRTCCRDPDCLEATPYHPVHTTQSTSKVSGNFPSMSRRPSRDQTAPPYTVSFSNLLFVQFLITHTLPSTPHFFSVGIVHFKYIMTAVVGIPIPAPTKNK